MLRFANLASGSSGNATLIESTDTTRSTRVLVDCGLGVKELDRRLGALGLSLTDLDALFITHEHADHIGHARAVLQRSQANICISHGTWLASDAPSWGLDERRIQWMHDATASTIGALQIHPFTVPHDAREPLQLTCTDGEVTLGVVTDLGHVSEHVVESLQGCNALILETNNDTDLLAKSAYPPFLKSRTSSFFFVSTEIAGSPAASAAAVSPPSTEKAKGKLEAENMATGPTGTRTRARLGWPTGGAPATAGSSVKAKAAPCSTCVAKPRSWKAVRSSSPFRRAGPRWVSESAAGRNKGGILAECATSALFTPGSHLFYTGSKMVDVLVECSISAQMLVVLALSNDFSLFIIIFEYRVEKKNFKAFDVNAKTHKQT